jgi:hypothetical protein
MAGKLKCCGLIVGLEFAVEPARRFGLQRVHVYLKLVDVTAPDASQRPVLESGACLNNSMDLRA